VPTFSIITPTLQRASLLHCCLSVDTQLDFVSGDIWQHIVVVDGGFLNAELLNTVRHPNRQFVFLGKRCGNFGNTPRHIGWKLATGDYCIYLDDDNYFARSDALADISRVLDLNHRPDWAVFPILRFGQAFFSDEPRCCHVDTANIVTKREIAQWPDGPEYTMDGIFCDALKERYPYIAFPEIAPIITVPVMSRGECEA
jgi:glycosyltransferase involved in cell wall biosynthesis